MPSDFPRSPRFLKGALVAYETPFLGPVPNVIVFQYNPDQLSRSLAHRAPPPDPKSVGAVREDVLRVFGPPVETITLTVDLDAADQLADPGRHPHIVARGLQPVLAALELLLYPPSAQVLLDRTMAQRGTAQISKKGEAAPLVLFVWGPSRVLPVLLTNFSVTEKAFDQALNPILAEVQLGMRVLTYMDLKEDHLGYRAYTATQTQKEVLARLNLVSSPERITGMLQF
jgi:hypothetical protein